MTEEKAIPDLESTIRVLDKNYSRVMKINDFVDHLRLLMESQRWSEFVEGRTREELQDIGTNSTLHYFANQIGQELTTLNERLYQLEALINSDLQKTKCAQMQK